MYLPAKNWHGTSVVGPMGSRTGLRGLASMPVHATNCPGPGCSVGTWDPSPPAGSITDQLQAEIDALFAYTGAGQSTPTPCDPGIDPTCGGSGKSLTDWLNANAGKVAIGAAAFVAIALFAKAGR